MEDDGFPTLEEILPRSDKARSDFSKSSIDELEPAKYEMGDSRLFELRTKYYILAHADLVPTRDDVVHTHCLGYCISYAYPFSGGLFSSSSLVSIGVLSLLQRMLGLALSLNP